MPAFKFRHGGMKEHEIGDRNCPACPLGSFTQSTLDRQGNPVMQVLRYPHICYKPRCGGLVHSEVVAGENGSYHYYECDVCHITLA